MFDREYGIKGTISVKERDWTYEGPDNLVYIFDKLTSTDINVLVEVIHRYGSKFDSSGVEVTAGTLPFYDRDVALKCVKEMLDNSPAYVPEPYSPLYKLVTYLDVSGFWVNISTIGSEDEVEINTVTNQRRSRGWAGLSGYAYR